MDERTQQRLLDTSNSLCLFSIGTVSEVEEVFSFRPSQDMDITPAQTLSRYTVILAQYLISLQVKFNTARVIASEKRKLLDRRVAEALAVGIPKGATQKERFANAILSDPLLREIEAEYDEAAAERDLLEGLDKPITELINALKSELRRRAEERNAVHRERL